MRYKLFGATLFTGFLLISGVTGAQASPVKQQTSSPLQMAYIPSGQDAESRIKVNTPQEKIEKRTNKKMFNKLKKYFQEQKRRKKPKIT